MNRLRVTQYVMEFTIPAAGEFAALRELREDSQLGLGCLDVRNEQIDSPEAIARRVEQALEFVAPSRITLNPDCGFAPGSAAEIPIDEAYAKLKSEVAAAQLLRAKYATA